MVGVGGDAGGVEGYEDVDGGGRGVFGGGGGAEEVGGGEGLGKEGGDFVGVPGGGHRVGEVSV